MPSHKQIQAAAVRAAEEQREEGRLEGVKQGRREILNWLEAKYMAPDAPARGSEEAGAILNLAREATEHIKELEKG